MPNQTYDNYGDSALLMAVSAPSGAGKSSLVNALIASCNNLVLSVSTTTRTKRPGEEDGAHYFFTDEADFLQRAQRGEFIEYAKVYGNYYGTSRRWLQGEIQANNDVIFEIDWQGAVALREQFPNMVSVFILPPDLNALRKRLEGREQDSASVIKKRVAAAVDEISRAINFDYVIVNQDFSASVRALTAIVEAWRCRFVRQRRRHSELFTSYSI